MTLSIEEIRTSDLGGEFSNLVVNYSANSERAKLSIEVTLPLRQGASLDSVLAAANAEAEAVLRQGLDE